MSESALHYSYVQTILKRDALGVLDWPTVIFSEHYQYKQEKRLGESITWSLKEKRFDLLTNSLI